MEHAADIKVGIAGCKGAFRAFVLSAAVTLGDARGDIISDPKKIIMKLHVSWRHASATQLAGHLVAGHGVLVDRTPHERRVLVDSDTW